MQYRIELNQFNQELIVRTNEDNSETWIPTDPANSDYQAYLKWLEENPSGTLS